MNAEIGDPLVGFITHVDVDALVNGIEATAPKPSCAKGGRPPYPAVLMIIPMLQELTNLVDDGRLQAARPP